MTDWVYFIKLNCMLITLLLPPNVKCMENGGNKCCLHFCISFNVFNRMEATWKQQNVASIYSLHVNSMGNGGNIEATFCCLHFCITFNVFNKMEATLEATKCCLQFKIHVNCMQICCLRVASMLPPRCLQFHVLFLWRRQHGGNKEATSLP